MTVRVTVEMEASCEAFTWNNAAEAIRLRIQDLIDHKRTDAQSSSLTTAILGAER